MKYNDKCLSVTLFLTWLSILTSCAQVNQSAPGKQIWSTEAATQQHESQILRSSQFLWEATQGSLQDERFVLKPVQEINISAVFRGVIFSNDKIITSSTIARGDYTNFFRAMYLDNLERQIYRRAGNARAIRSLGNFKASPVLPVISALKENGTMYVFDTSQHKLITQYESIISDVTGAAFSPTLPQFVFTKEDGFFNKIVKLKSVNLENWDDQFVIDHVGTVRDITFTSDGRLILVANDDGKVLVYRSQTGKYLETIDTKLNIKKFGDLLNPSRIAILSGASQLNILNLGDGKLKKVFSAEQDLQHFKFINQDLVLAVALEGKLQLIDVGTKEILTTYDHGSVITGIDYLTQRNLLASVSSNGEAKIIEVNFDNNHDKLFQQKVATNSDRFFEYYYDREVSPESNQIAAVSYIRDIFLETFGEPKITSIKHDSDLGFYEIKVMTNSQKTWLFGINFRVDEKLLVRQEDPQKLFSKMKPVLTFEINNKGLLELESAKLVSNNNHINLTPIAPFRPIELEYRLSTVASGNVVENSTAQRGLKATNRVSDQLRLGNYHALVIGNNVYHDFPILESAKTDAIVLSNLLQHNYGFSVRTLTDATRADILSALDDYRKVLKEDDNLIVYYAGHGYYDAETERGYWLPIDAAEESSYDWISNADLTDRLKAIKSKHVMVIADSCYSGTLTRGVKQKVVNNKYWERISSKKSRTVLTSGGLEPVLDSGGGIHSVFAKALINTLKTNDSLIDGTTLFEKVRRSVIRNADQTPQYSDIRYAGHDGGDFIFKRTN